MIIKKYQVTLYCNDNKYKPISCIIDYEQSQDIDLTFDALIRKDIQTQGVKKICIKKNWTKKDLIKYNYTKCKARAYSL